MPNSLVIFSLPPQTQTCCLQIVIHRNDLYRIELQPKFVTKRLTRDGNAGGDGGNAILNGLNDQSYRGNFELSMEKFENNLEIFFVDFIFQKTSSIWWSKNGTGRWFCWLKINNSEIPLLYNLHKHHIDAQEVPESFHYPTVISKQFK